MRIAVCGDGPIALSIAAVCGWRGHAVSVLTREPRTWRPWIAGALPDGTTFTAPIAMATTSCSRAMDGAQMVFICVPLHEIEQMTRRVARYAMPSMLVGAIPGYGGFGWHASRYLPANVVAFGTQRIPFVIRGSIAGRAVHIGGVRRQTFVGAIPARRAYVVAERLQHVLGVPTVPVSHYINVELSPSNSLMNPARLYALFGPHARRMPSAKTEFFADWDMRSSRTLLALDRELQMGRLHIPRDTSFVTPILMQYDANDGRTLTRRIRRLRALGGRPVPVRQHGGRVTLNTRSAYVVGDIDRGLALVADILRLSGARTTVMDTIFAWRNTLNRSRVAMPAPITVARRFTAIEALVSAFD